MTITRIPTLVLLAALTRVGAGDAASLPAWPQIAGPYGDHRGLPLPPGAKAISDVKSFRRVWKSEIDDIGLAKWSGPNGGFDPGPGGRASPIVAEGMIFQAYFRYAGDKRVDTAGLRKVGKFSLNHPDKALLEADDCLVAVDCATGKTVWRVAHPRSGLNNYAGKRGGWGVSAVYADGRVFHAGTTWKVWGLEAKTGRQLWETAIEPMHSQLEALRKRDLAAASPKANEKEMPTELSSLVVADGVLVVPRRGGLIGLDPATGDRRWELNQQVQYGSSTPAIWRHGGREYLLVHDGAKLLRLIDARAGKILWQLETAPNLMTLQPHTDHVLVYAKLLGPEKSPALWGAVRLSPTQGTLAWVMPDEQRLRSAWWKDTGPMRKIAFDGKGLAYIFNRSAKVAASGDGDGDADGGGATSKPIEMHHVYVVRVTTGELVKVYAMSDLKAGWWHNFNVPVLLGDRIFVCHDNSHDLHGITLFEIDGTGSLTVLSSDEGWHADIPMTMGYETPIEWGYHDGRIITRGYDGRLHCWDLLEPR